MIWDRGVKALPHEAKERHEARPLLLAPALPASRSLPFVLGVLLVAAVGLIVALVTAPTSVAAPIPATRTVTVIAPPTICERALKAKLATLEFALAEALAGHRYQARGVLFGQALVLPGGCGP